MTPESSLRGMFRSFRKPGDIALVRKWEPFNLLRLVWRECRLLDVRARTLLRVSELMLPVNLG